MCDGPGRLGTGRCRAGLAACKPRPGVRPRPGRGRARGVQQGDGRARRMGWRWEEMGRLGPSAGVAGSPQQGNFLTPGL